MESLYVFVRKAIGDVPIIEVNYMLVEVLKRFPATGHNLYEFVYVGVTNVYLLQLIQNVPGQWLKPQLR